MSSRRLALPLVLLLVIVACAGAEAAESPEPPRPPTQSTTTTTTTTTLPTTTTMLAPLSIAGAPAPLSDVVQQFYAYAVAASDQPPKLPDRLLSAIAPSPGSAPTSGNASLAVFAEQQVGVVEAGPDIFLVVDDGSGWRIVGGDWPSQGIAAYFGEGPRHVAVVGSDARPGERVDRTRADSIHFVGLDGVGGGAVVGLPRDSYVNVPGFGRMKATGSLARGGPETMMETFNELTALPLEGYVLTGFAGFQEMAGTVLGGVSVEVPFNISDQWAHVNLNAGLQLLNGAQALGFARARKTVPGGDLTRSAHQGIILLSAAGAVKALGYASIPGLMEASEPHLMTDLTPEQLLTFSAMAIAADLENVANVVAPGRPGGAGGASVVFLNDSVSALWEDLADGRLDG
jgi:LCP family protein required for cell wall assembly